MRRPTGTTVVRILLALLAAVALVIAGRVSADTASARASGYRDGVSDGHYAGYFDGLHDGRSRGLEEGRTLQEADALPARSRHRARQAFVAGYEAGANDIFAGYDGGWALGAPYVVILGHGAGPRAYRISSRTPVKAGVAYVLCPDGTGICQRLLP